LRAAGTRQISKFEVNKIPGNCGAWGEDVEGHRGRSHRLHANERPEAIGITPATPRRTSRSDHSFQHPFHARIFGLQIAL
jgi:hypothetical protein